MILRESVCDDCSAVAYVDPGWEGAVRCLGCWSAAYGGAGQVALFGEHPRYAGGALPSATEVAPPRPVPPDIGLTLYRAPAPFPSVREAVGPMTASIHTNGRWLVAGTPANEPYPCLCEKIDDDPPLWKVERARRSGDPTVYICDPYIKKGSNEWRNRCSCWGRKPEGAPEGCCARHEGNPRFRVVIDGFTVTPDGPVPAAHTSPFSEPSEAHDLVPPGPPPLRDMLHLPEPYRPRWAVGELHCSCSTPWDGITDARKVGYHCTGEGCHQNFRNWSMSVAHKRVVTDPCRDPARQLNIDGMPAYRMTTVGQHVVWS